jgi:cell division protein FtsQ
MKISRRKWAILGTIIIWIGILSYLGTSIFFVKGKDKDIICRRVEVVVADSVKSKFIAKDDVIRMANREVKTLVGTRLSRINTHRIERRILELPFVKNAEAYTTVSGVLKIKVEQREAIMRLFNPDGSSCYIDSQGYMIPLSDRSAADVVVVSGNISLKVKKNGRVKVVNAAKDSSYRKGLLPQLFDFVSYIRNDEFWNAQIEQIYVNSSNDVELVTRVGNHTVLLGSLDEFRAKLKKLFIFYKNALPSEGWNKYSVINVKYANQVICKK